jgi:hypothetical protein
MGGTLARPGGEASTSAPAAGPRVETRYRSCVRSRAFVALGGLAVAGCPGPEPAPQTRVVPLVDHAAWATVEAADDPLADHRPEPVLCDAGSTYQEGDDFEVDTDGCNYYAGAQGALFDVAAGDPIHARMWHFGLLPDSDGEAHVALLAGDVVLWQEVVPLEAGVEVEADLYEVDFAAPVAIEAGSPLVLHVHNHGSNTWALRDLEAEITEP